MEQKSEERSARRARRAALHRYSGFWFALALVSAVVSTVVMIAEAPRDPYDAAGISSVDAWLRPTHPGRARQMNTLRADLNGVAVSNDGKTVWVAGNAGLIAVSTDGGDHWQKETISGIEAGAMPKATSTAVRTLTANTSENATATETASSATETTATSSRTKKH